jgi:sulfide:quinone oxidoreductase
MALANRLVRRLDGAQITMIDPRPNHLYQPGLTLVGGGAETRQLRGLRNSDWLPSGVSFVADKVSAVDAISKTVSTEGGQTLDYDWLVVAPGLVLDHDAIEGFSLDMVGENGIGALYAGPEYAAKTWTAASRFTEEGGTGIFTRPATEMKCAGAPLKHTFLIDDIARRAGNAGKVNMVYAAPQGSLFGVPIVAEKVRMLFEDRGRRDDDEPHADGHRRGRKTRDLRHRDRDRRGGLRLHPRHPAATRAGVRGQSGLAWADKWTDQGWVECDMQTLRHLRYPEIFALGDVAGVPKGKTAPRSNGRCRWSRIT